MDNHKKFENKENYYARVICPIHGYIGLTQQEYNRQMNLPDSLWKCGCGESALFDDEFFEDVHEIE